MAFGMIGFDHYKISCIIGVNEEERLLPQDIFVDLKVEYDFSLPAKNDEFEKTICYESLGKLLENLAKIKQYKLLETFAYELIEKLINEMKVSYAFVRIKKTSALKSASYALVELQGGKRVWQ